MCKICAICGRGNATSSPVHDECYQEFMVDLEREQRKELNELYELEVQADYALMYDEPIEEPHQDGTDLWTAIHVMDYF